MWCLQATTWPVAIAIISVEEGIVKDITWDYGCFDCLPQSCGPNTYRLNGAALESAGDECFQCVFTRKRSTFAATR